MLLRYLKMHLRSALVFLLCVVVFLVVFGLFQLPAQAVGYASLLAAFFCAIVYVPDYLAFCRKHRLLELLEKEVTVTLDNLPQPSNIVEEDYQKMLTEVYRDKHRLQRRERQKYSDLIEYFTVWVHQIKTPIAAMRLLLQSEESPENRELSEELQRIEQYVEMVLGYLRLDADSTDYVIKEYDLDAIIKQVVRKYASQFIRKKIRLVYEPLQVMVLSDEKWLSFIIEQVLSNALKYTKTGEIAITLEKPKLLCIRDTGIGVAPEDLPRIFEKGYTGYNGRADKKATGIGLYLCRRIAEKLGHTISAASKPGVGTVIRIDLESTTLEVE